MSALLLVTRAGSLAHRMTAGLPTALPLASLIHGSGSLGSNAGLLLAGGGRLRTPPKRRVHPICDSGRENLGPFVDRLIGDADCFSGGGYRPTEQLNSFSFTHAELNHSSRRRATIVPVPAGMFATMVAYKDRLAHAMKLATKTEHDLANALGITYTGVKKALKGGPDGTSAMSAANNAKAAKFLGVSSDWLATGEGAIRGEPPLALTDEERYMILAARQMKASRTTGETAQYQGVERRHTVQHVDFERRSEWPKVMGQFGHDDETPKRGRSSQKKEKKQ